MDIIESEKLAISLMEKFQLRTLNNFWIIKWSKSKTACGYCNYRKKYIKLATLYVIHSNEQDVKDTILHEIAHALVGKNHGHDNIWKLKCIEIGATPKRCSENYNIKHEGKWEIFCPKCGIIGYKYKKINTERKRICRKCNSVVEIKINEKFCQK